MIHITHSTLSHLEGLTALDGHLDQAQMERKISAGEVIHAEHGSTILGILRYSLFWDELPFMNLIRVAEQHQRQGVGRSLVATWEQSMAKLGHRCVLTSTQADEQAQHFYRCLGYTDIGGFVMPSEPLEIILHKPIA